MTEETLDDEGIPQGTTQAIWWEILMREHILPSPYANSLYPEDVMISLNNMLDRAKEAGYVIERESGPRGGETKAEYRLKRRPDGKEIVVHSRRTSRGIERVND